MKILLWGSSVGVTNYFDYLGNRKIVGIVSAANRPNDLSATESLAKKYNLPVYLQPFKREKKKYRAFLRVIELIKADIFLSNAYSMILDETILSYPKIGAFNVHGGLLPQYRGANVLNWVLINGEKETGVTIHYINNGIDTGDIVSQRRINIAMNDTAITLRDKILQVAGDMLIEVIPKIETKTNIRLKQDESLAKYWNGRKPDDGLFEWTWPAIRIYNLIRALVSPWPGAFYFDKDGRKAILDYFIPLEEVKKLQKEQIGCIIE